MRRTDCTQLYQLAEQFLAQFLLQGNSLLTQHKGILSKATLESCHQRYIGQYDDSKARFGEKIKKQFQDADLPTRLTFAHIEWLWAVGANDLRPSTKRVLTERTLADERIVLEEVYPNGFGNAGTYHKQNKYLEINFLLLLLQFLHDKVAAGNIQDVATAKKWIEAVCLWKKYEEVQPEYPIAEAWQQQFPEKHIAMCDMLNHLFLPDSYERIASEGHKGRIVTSFAGILPESSSEQNTDQQILSIRAALTQLTGEQDFDFYEDRYAKVWNYALSKEGFDEVQGLLYKKAIVLYGPPGTSKTHTAKRLAEALITKRYLETAKNVPTYFEDKADFLEGRIHRLQLHSNYTYEDFVAGIQLREQATVAVKGKLFDICEAAAKDSLPHILILDEINRVDVSRLFGEVFSALENRNEVIALSVGGFELCIPDNLYVIGTMNEIDFSLERIDFALRRRFLWFFYGFNADTLREMIAQKDQALKTRLPEAEIDRFVMAAESLNHAIDDIPELGRQYQIGHTFFAEVVDIFAAYKQIKNIKSPRKKLYRNEGAVKILWDISIAPMLDAFLGNLDEYSKKQFLDKLRETYFA